MKKKILAMAVATLTLGVAGCVKENGGSSVANEQGKATFIKISLTTPPGSATRANTTDDPNGTPDESKVTSVDVFIYTASGIYLSAAHLTGDDFTQGQSTSDADTYLYTASAKIPTTTGPKSILVGINLPTSVVNSLKSNTATAAYWAVQTMSKEELAGASNFAMFSVEPVNGNFVEDATDPANNLTIKCQRLVAKVTVETSATLAQDGIHGTLGNLTFAINNFNTKLFMIQSDAPNYQDPNWTSGSWADSDFVQSSEAEYLPILSRAVINNPEITDYSPGYAAENTSQDKTRKELTRVTVRATFIPRDITEGNSGNFTVNSAHGVTTPTTFYAITPSIEDGTSYFFDAAIALAFSNDNGGATIVTYNDGLCYWNIYLNKTPINPINRWDVLRNDYYKCNITRIVAPGRPTPDIQYPDLPPDVDTSITTDIEILFWNNPLTSDYVLQ